MVDHGQSYSEIIKNKLWTSFIPLKKITHVMYINLEKRLDRKKHVEAQLSNLGLDKYMERFNAIPLADGRIGCSMSHLKCLQLAKERNWDHVFICEDDILFLDQELFKKNLAHFLSSEIKWDVVLVAGNNVPPYCRVCDEYIKVLTCQTTTGYIVRAHYYDTLMQNIKEGMQLLMRDPANHFQYAIDKYWFRLQQQDEWFLITPPTVVQREDYSDIEKKRTNYSHLMTDLNKQWLSRGRRSYNSTSKEI
jgi:GR25 family glycosyltransferase involved in LPS biosynthesis